MCWREQQATDSTEEKLHWLSVGLVLPQLPLTSLCFAVRIHFIQNPLQKEIKV